MDQFLNFKLMNLTKKAQKNVCLHQRIHQDLKRISTIIYISGIDHNSFKFIMQKKIEMINCIQLQLINFISLHQKQNMPMKISHNNKKQTGKLQKCHKMKKAKSNHTSYHTLCNKKKSDYKLRDFNTKHKATLRNFPKTQNRDYTNDIQYILINQKINNRQFANLIFDVEYNPPSEHEENDDMELDEISHQGNIILQDDMESHSEQNIPTNANTNLQTDTEMPPLRVLNVTESFDCLQSHNETINNANSTNTNSNATMDTVKIASESFLSFF